MRTTYKLARVDEGKCTGDKACENVCPTGAIQVADEKARVDESKCAACRRCLDACREGAIRIVSRKEPLVLGIPPEELENADKSRISQLCEKAGFSPDEPVCLCTITRARELAAAVLMGAKTPQEVSRRTGLRTYCAMWCSSPVQRMLRAHGLEIPDEPGYRQYNVDVSLSNIPDAVAEKYPEYRIDEDRKSSEEGTLDNLTSNLW